MPGQTLARLPARLPQASLKPTGSENRFIETSRHPQSFPWRVSHSHGLKHNLITIQNFSASEGRARPAELQTTKRVVRSLSTWRSLAHDRLSNNTVMSKVHRNFAQRRKTMCDGPPRKLQTKVPNCSSRALPVSLICMHQQKGLWCHH